MLCFAAAAAVLLDCRNTHCHVTGSALWTDSVGCFEFDWAVSRVVVSGGWWLWLCFSPCGSASALFAFRGYRGCFIGPSPLSPLSFPVFELVSVCLFRLSLVVGDDEN